MVVLIPLQCRWETYVQENVNYCPRSTKPTSRHHNLGNIWVSDSGCAQRPCLDSILGWNPRACQPSFPRTLVTIGRTPGHLSQAGATVNPKRCPAWLVREPDAVDGVPWQLDVLQAEPQKKTKPKTPPTFTTLTAVLRCKSVLYGPKHLAGLKCSNGSQCAGTVFK